MATLLALRTKLRGRVGNPDTTSVPDSELTENLNDAHRDLATGFRHHKVRKLCEFPTVAGTQEYGLPTDAGAILSVWDITNGNKLTKKGWPQKEYPASPPQAKPKQYIRLRNYVVIGPNPPDGVYTIRLYYRENVADLSADGDLPLTPSTWDNGLLMLARWYHFDGRGDVPKAVYALRAYERWVKHRSTEVEEEMQHFDSAVQVPTWQSGDKRLDFDHAD